MGLSVCGPQGACVTSMLCGAVRSAHVELVLTAGNDYTLHPLVFRARGARDASHDFVLAIFSANSVAVRRDDVLR
eukprot:CAMPEP_0184500668 /NCGR_PEP_ID=MMETSP0113_2-20130426/45474_1 /TAXON_ID=91329 /ORGANISM="Norrisiella sphaerica, Strain BC52" /LENGTH=74 /DNA_ID=CAMNT_0026889137 /DNA_START=18 /DNA_END=239 /DNA_ORIENTATION=-